MEKAIFGAGCFWGVQSYFDQVSGVVETEVGYSGGHVDNPTYELVAAHTTGHAEVTRIVFDPNKVSYKILLGQFFRMHNPTQLNRQGPDVGDNYRSAIFYKNKEQKQTAQDLINKLNIFGKYKKPLATTLEQFKKFWPAEDYHQKFSQRTGHGVCRVDYAPIEN